jgi:Protein of unknown function (DUF732)
MERHAHSADAQLSDTSGRSKPPGLLPRQAVLLAVIAALGRAVAGIGEAPSAHADATAYLVNVTVRPGYNFANADQALAYGQGICDKIAAGRHYGDVVADIKTDFNTSDEYQASYLISQAAQELCPNLVWQLRNSAAHYVPPRGG